MKENVYEERELALISTVMRIKNNVEHTKEILLFIKKKLTISVHKNKTGNRKCDILNESK